jgi:hypothetical protein
VERLYGVIGRVAALMHEYERGLVTLIEDMRKVKYEDGVVLEEDELERMNKFSTDDAAALARVQGLIIDLTAVYHVRVLTLAISSAIEVARARGLNHHIEPKINVRHEARVEAKAADAIAEYEWA